MTDPNGDLSWIDGNLVPSEQATLHVLSHSVQRGSTVFDVMKVVQVADGANVFGLREHVARFMQSMTMMGMTPAFGLADLEAGVGETVAANPGAHIVKIVAVWAEVPLLALPLSPTPTIFIAAMKPVADAGPERTTITLRTADAPKIPSTVLPPSLKVAASYTPGIRERMTAAAEGFDDVVFRTAEGDLAEGTTQSLFVVSDGRLVLPPLDNVLDGITRRSVIDLARHADIDVEIRPVHWDEVTGADELFLSSTVGPVLAVSRLDERELPAPGPVTQQLANEMSALLIGEHQRSSRWLTPVG